VGQTKGRGRNGPNEATKSIKAIYVYSLVHDLAERVGVKPPTVIALSPESGLEGVGWVEQEFGNCELGDERLAQRLVKIVGDKAAQPQESYAQAAGGNRHDLKGYYRFVNSQRLCTQYSVGPLIVNWLHQFRLFILDDFALLLTRVFFFRLKPA
jgi:hypothetical protein